MRQCRPHSDARDGKTPCRDRVIPVPDRAAAQPRSRTDRFRLARVWLPAASAIWLCGGLASGSLAPAPVGDSAVDEAAVKTAGIRKLTGRHIALYTDLPAGAGVDALPRLFDQAYPQWCAYFELPQAADRDWRVVACVMGDRDRFRRAGLLPADLPEFLHAYYRGDRLWVNEQGSDYYRRHLLLHEGTHAFVEAMFGSCGPPWYMEGVAELLATHALADGRLTLGHFPRSREETPLWGRIKLVRDAAAQGRALGLDDVLAFGPRAHLQTEPYGWCWATAAFLDGHPRYRDRFRGLKRELGAADFTARFQEAFAADWAQLGAEWEAFIANLEYGYDLKRNQIEFRTGDPLGAAGRTVTIRADRGWQSTGIRLEGGQQYRLTAQGRYLLAGKPKPWPSEPGGVTIRYWQGRPLGMLLAAVQPDKREPAARSEVDRAGTLAAPVAVGPQATITPSATGTLYLKVNDSPAELSDNSGTLEVTVIKLADAAALPARHD